MYIVHVLCFFKNLANGSNVGRGRVESMMCDACGARGISNGGGCGS